ncbi:MAG: hypothetical protein SH859_15960 [Hyphomicrobium aestuarii]|nr:hypothetical protein [Hyphomicrobium aestuarii]
MPDGLTRYRVAIQAFGEWDTLSDVVGSLVERGFEGGQFCIFGRVAQPAAVEMAAGNGRADRTSDAGLETKLATVPTSLATLSSQPPVHLHVAGHEPVEMRCGRAAIQLFAHADGDTYEAGWMRPDLTQSLASDVDDGFVVLLLMSQTADQQALGARLLLRHGTRELRTHEFSARQM